MFWRKEWLPLTMPALTITLTTNTTMVTRSMVQSALPSAIAHPHGQLDAEGRRRDLAGGSRRATDIGFGAHVQRILQYFDRGDIAEPLQLGREFVDDGNGTGVIAV